MATSAEKMRAWSGPAILSVGLRPFFLLGAIWAALAMALWVAMLSGRDVLPTAFDPVSWHAHEFLFGYLGAVMAGFLLTAVPNWTGRLPVVGWPLAGLVALWLGWARSDCRVGADALGAGDGVGSCLSLGSGGGAGQRDRGGAQLEEPCRSGACVWDGRCQCDVSSGCGGRGLSGQRFRLAAGACRGRHADFADRRTHRSQFYP